MYCIVLYEAMACKGQGQKEGRRAVEAGPWESGWWKRGRRARGRKRKRNGEAKGGRRKRSRGARGETKAEPVRQKERDENGTGEARGRKGDERRGVKTGLQGERQGRR